LCVEALFGHNINDQPAIRKVGGKPRLRYTKSEGDLPAHGDGDGNGSTDFQIELNNLGAIKQAYFVL
jgi:hypothetical protein